MVGVTPVVPVCLKTVLDAAYRQIHANAKTASTCIAIVNELDFLCLRLPFCTTPAPAEYTAASEAAIDLGNDLLQDQSWDTDDLNSPYFPGPSGLFLNKRVQRESLQS